MELHQLKGILKGLKGTMENKLNRMGRIIYNYGMEGYGLFQKARKEKQSQNQVKTTVWNRKADLRKEAAE